MFLFQYDMSQSLQNFISSRTSQLAPHIGVMVRACASQSVDLEFNSQVESYQKTLKNGIHSFPAWSSSHRDSVEN